MSRSASSSDSFLASSLLSRGSVVLGGLFLAISTLTRLALLFQGRGDVAWDLSLLGSFAYGLWYDALALCFALIPWLLLSLSTWPQLCA